MCLSSLIRFSDPFSRKMPSTVVAKTSWRQHHARPFAASETQHPPFSFKKTPHFATTMGT